MKENVLLEITVVHRKLMKLYGNILKRQATTPVLPCVRLKYCDPQWTKF